MAKWANLKLRPASESYAGRSISERMSPRPLLDIISHVNDRLQGTVQGSSITALCLIFQAG